MTYTHAHEAIRAWTQANETARATYHAEQHCACGALTGRRPIGDIRGARCADCKKEKP